MYHMEKKKKCDKPAKSYSVGGCVKWFDDDEWWMGLLYMCLLVASC